MHQDTPVSYSRFFSRGQQTEDTERLRATVGVFPIFYEKTSTMAMPKHAMLVVKKATEFVKSRSVNSQLLKETVLSIFNTKKCQ